MLQKGIKQRIYTAIVKPDDFLGNTEGFAVINKVWDLRSLASTDDRYKDAYGDFRQHIINNHDWDIDEMFYDRLNLLDSSDQIFYKFLESYVNPEIRRDKAFIEQKIAIINPLLIQAGMIMQVGDYFEDRPIYRVTAKSTDVVVKNDTKSAGPTFYTPAAEHFSMPSFLLSRVDADDSIYGTTVKLDYYASVELSVELGHLTVLKKGMPPGSHIIERLPSSFKVLSDEFCSLAINGSYYTYLKEKFPDQYHQILISLRDAAIFPRIAEEFESDSAFIDIVQQDISAEEVIRTIRYQLAGIDYGQAFKFHYDFQPPYADYGIDIDFDFVYGDDVEIEHRIYVLIGKNGVGKTRILSGIASQLELDTPTHIGPLKPLFGKIFTLSYSIFDSFKIPKGHANYNYIYCGLKKNENEHFTREELRNRFKLSAAKIKQRNLMNDWKEVLANFIELDLLNQMFSFNKDDYNFKNNFSSIERLSSGQHILLYVLTEMLAEIRNNSLILYDEPETHLHPNAIAELMNSLLGLVKKFNSFCIIGTHSPLVVQCVQSRNVYVIKRDENEIELQYMQRETFGENLTAITEDIFGNREVEKDYLNLLKDLKEQGHTYDQILSMFENENNLPLNTNARLQLKSLFTS